MIRVLTREWASNLRDTTPILAEDTGADFEEKLVIRGARAALEWARDSCDACQGRGTWKDTPDAEPIPCLECMRIRAVLERDDAGEAEAMDRRGC